MSQIHVSLTAYHRNLVFKKMYIFDKSICYGIIFIVIIASRQIDRNRKDTIDYRWKVGEASCNFYFT